MVEIITIHSDKKSLLDKDTYKEPNFDLREFTLKDGNTVIVNEGEFYQFFFKNGKNVYEVNTAEFIKGMNIVYEDMKKNFTIKNVDI